MRPTQRHLRLQWVLLIMTLPFAAPPGLPAEDLQAPVITRQPADTLRGLGRRARFTVVAGGSALTYQWQFGGADLPGATDSTLMLTNLSSADEGPYRVRVSNVAGTALSTEARLTVVSPPVITAQPPSQWLPYGRPFTFSVTATSRVDVAYEWYLNGQRYQAITAGSWNGIARKATAGTWTVVAIDQTFFQKSTSAPWTLTVPLPGSVVDWGLREDRQAAPAGMTNLAAIAAGTSCVLGLTSEETVIAWGSSSHGETNVPAGLNEVQAIAAGDAHALALRYDGTVVGWGQGGSPPSGLSGVVAIAAGTNHSLALKQDGTVVVWGEAAPRVPAGLSKVVAVASGAASLHDLALKQDGTVVAWGRNDHGQADVPPGLSGVVAISAGATHSLALKSDGTLVAWGDNAQGQCDLPPGLSNAMSIAAGFHHSLALRNDGSVVAWGANLQGQSAVPSGLGEVTALAAGEQSLALIYSATVQYPVKAQTDLLLIYNTTSPDSAALKDYYLANRPMASDANVLGIACAAGEFISLAELKATILAPVSRWLAAHPTRRPRYVILFLGVPSRRSVPTTPVPGLPMGSVSYVLREVFPVRKPFVAHLHMGSLADCQAYIDKLKRFGTTSSPGRLLLRASRGGYRNNRYYFDDVTRYPEKPGSTARAALLANGVPASSVVYTTQEHIARATDVAGFMNWGSNGGLGGNYANDGTVRFSGQSGWYLIQTIESFNGQRAVHQGNFIDWFSGNAFGGTGHANTPVGAVSYTEEPSTGGVNDASYFVHWALGRDLGTCAWNSSHTTDFQVVGDPLVAR